MNVTGIPQAFIKAFEDKPTIRVVGEPSKAPNGCPYEIENNPDGSQTYYFEACSSSFGSPFGRKNNPEKRCYNG